MSYIGSLELLCIMNFVRLALFILLVGVIADCPPTCAAVSLRDAIHNGKIPEDPLLSPDYRCDLLVVATSGVPRTISSTPQREAIAFRLIGGDHSDRRHPLRIVSRSDKARGISALSALYVPRIPRHERLLGSRYVRDLELILGRFRGISDGWIVSGRLHSSRWWTVFECQNDAALHLVEVFVHTVRRAPFSTRIDGMKIQEGLLVSKTESSTSRRRNQIFAMASEARRRSSILCAGALECI